MSYTDFKIAGATMTESQWISFLAVILPNIDQMLNRYCNVTSFDPATSIVEYHSGRGANDDEMGGYSPRYFTYGLDTQGTTYLTSDKTFNLREVFYTLTSVEEDVSPKTSVASWQTRTQRGITAGDFEVYTKNEVTSIVFHNNIPMYGDNNVRITYKCGYGTTTSQYAEIKLQALRMVTNFLLLKKKVQEAVNIRAQGIRDYSQMFDISNESMVLTPNIKEVLDKYRRYPIEGSLFD
jgi:hypothetical protein